MQERRYSLDIRQKNWKTFSLGCSRGLEAMDLSHRWQKSVTPIRAGFRHV